MKSLALSITLFTFCEPAIAKTVECQSIPKASGRLACYDKAMPPAGRAKPSSAVRVSESQPGQVVDKACRGKRTVGRQDQEYLPWLLMRIGGRTPHRLMQPRPSWSMNGFCDANGSHIFHV
jgi:hypothetical protein